METYYWVTAFLTLVCCLYVPSDLPRQRNLTGSTIVAAFGFIVWPFVLYAAWVIWYERFKEKRRKPEAPAKVPAALTQTELNAMLDHLIQQMSTNGLPATLSSEQAVAYQLGLMEGHRLALQRQKDDAP